MTSPLLTRARVPVHLVPLPPPALPNAKVEGEWPATRILQIVAYLMVLLAGSIWLPAPWNALTPVILFGVTAVTTIGVMFWRGQEIAIFKIRFAIMRRSDDHTR